MKYDDIPDFLLKWVINSLLGEIYPEIRAIAIGVLKKNVIVRYYIDREIIENDYECIDVVISNILSNTSSNDLFDIKGELIKSNDYFKDLEPLSGFVYARME